MLFRSIQYDKPELQMPPSGKLPPAEIQILDQWIRAGAPDPRVQIPELASDKPTGMSIEAGRDFWSIRPLAAPKIPRTQHPEWCRNPIDAFLDARMSRAGLRPTESARRETLLRRLSLDLTGLPPTPAEIQEFLNDPSADAYDRQVERLLASPRRGERLANEIGRAHV